ncbi:hypothetical protein LOC68_01150 [Blastopirellula sp. JC732]|uniref:Uncharacterized protein n=1 Tax=Blastopirellula sediminis TaxID=2894196 RepID=A0A9X1MI50_9BACT|nr:hypothetical protein [Blastopirellula sediminis]MCC9608206.1 hypothetical protein [Blastopirellula sediminis]MCC9627001.1 hypothetical protein [Blastopirellula sediminis]
MDTHAERHKYQVSVGHTSVIVQSNSPTDAIRAAREKMCRDFPRLWDVISKLADSRFQVLDLWPAA